MDNFDGVWAVVTAGVKQYIGRIHSQSGSLYTNDNKDAVLTAWENNNVIKISPVFQVSELIAPAPQGMQRLVNGVPIGLFGEDVTIFTKPSDIIFFEDMKEKDLARYKGLVKTARNIADTTRIKDSNISVVPASGMPRH